MSFKLTQPVIESFGNTQISNLKVADNFIPQLTYWFVLHVSIANALFVEKVKSISSKWAMW